MNGFFIKIGRREIKIDKRSFLALFKVSPVKRYVAYKNAVENNEIRFTDLKKLSIKADIPYPLFFAKKGVVDVHIEDEKKNLYEKLPSKQEMKLNFRGEVGIEDILLIVKDLGRKQEFFKKRILTTSLDNSFVGLITREVKAKVTNEELADTIRQHLGIDLSEMRGMRGKNSALKYLCDRVEEQEVFVSFSSYNYMPQNISKYVNISGFCVKDRKFPYIFINTRDGDENPKILETSGRQIFTLVSMLVCIAMNKFILSTNDGDTNLDNDTRKIYSIVGELLIPKSDIKGIEIHSLEDLNHWARFFKVTPSMLLVRFRELNLIDQSSADRLHRRIKKEIGKVPTTSMRSPLPVNGYSKYNGNRFSKEVLRAYAGKKISTKETQNILFKKGKIDSILLKKYINKFK